MISRMSLYLYPPNVVKEEDAILIDNIIYIDEKPDEKGEIKFISQTLYSDKTVNTNGFFKESSYPLYYIKRTEYEPEINR